MYAFSNSILTKWLVEQLAQKSVNRTLYQIVQAVTLIKALHRKYMKLFPFN
jgi:hypothetical protein